MSHISHSGMLSKVKFHNEEAEPRMHFYLMTKATPIPFDFFLIFSNKVGGGCACMYSVMSDSFQPCGP